MTIMTDDMYDQSMKWRNSIENTVGRHSSYTNGWALLSDNFDTLLKILMWIVIGVAIFLTVALGTDQIDAAGELISSIWFGFWNIILTIAWWVTISPVARVVWIFGFPTFLMVFLNIPRRISCLRHIDLNMLRKFPVHIKLYRKSEVFDELTIGCDELGHGIFDWWFLKHIKRAVLNIMNRVNDYKVMPSSYSTKNMFPTKTFNFTGSDAGDFDNEDVSFFTTSCGEGEPAISVITDENGDDWAFFRTSEIHNISEMEAILGWEDNEGLVKTNAKLQRRIIELERKDKLRPIDQAFEIFADLFTDDSIEFNKVLKDSVRDSNSNFSDLVSKSNEKASKFTEEQLKHYNAKFGRTEEEQRER